MGRTLGEEMNETHTCTYCERPVDCVHSDPKPSYNFGLALIAGVAVAGILALGLAIIITLAECVAKL